MLLHLGNESTGHTCFLVPRSPNEQLQKYRRKINPFFGEPVINSPSIRLLRLRSYDLRRFELL